MLSQLRTSVVVLLGMTLLTGLAYPATVTAVAAWLFPHQAEGCLIVHDGQVVGSELIGQQFSSPKYFWGRLSATAPMPYNATASSGSNLGPSNPDLLKQARERQAALEVSSQAQVPIDLLTASGSGLDPHISLEAALIQVPRVAKARGLAEDRVADIVRQHIEARDLGILGQPRINVLKLNLAVDTQ